VETVLAMANGRSLDQAKAILDDIRYADGKPSFQSRNHFTEAQWLPANARKGYLADEVPALDRRAPAETLILDKSQWTQVPGLKRLIPADVPDGEYRESRPPRASAAQVTWAWRTFVSDGCDPDGSSRKRSVRFGLRLFVFRGLGGSVGIRLQRLLPLLQQLAGARKVAARHEDV